MFGGDRYRDVEFYIGKIAESSWYDLDAAVLFCTHDMAEELEMAKTMIMESASLNKTDEIVLEEDIGV